MEKLTDLPITTTNHEDEEIKLLRQILEELGKLQQTSGVSSQLPESLMSVAGKVAGGEGLTDLLPELLSSVGEELLSLAPDLLTLLL